MSAQGDGLKDKECNEHDMAVANHLSDELARHRGISLNNEEKKAVLNLDPRALFEKDVEQKVRELVSEPACS